MSPQEVINTLSDLEQFFFYAKNSHEYAPYAEQMQKLHEMADDMLSDFADVSGLLPD